MKKKILALLCLLSIIVTMVPGYAFAKEADGTSEKTAVLASLGIHNSKASGLATNEYLLSALSGFLYQAEERPTAEDFARAIGVLSFGDIYDANKTVTKKEAIEYALAVLGYKTYAESTGAGGIKTVASSIELSKGFGTINDDAATISECVILLYNMLEIAPMSAVYSQGEIKHIIENGHTLLSKYRDVHRLYGVLTSNGITSLDREAGCTEGCIKIGDSIYETEDNKVYADLLGKNVEAYVVKNEPYEPTVLYLGERSGRNKEFELNARDIERVESDYSKIEYYENNRLKKIKLADVPKVIYNGVFYGKYTVADFMPESGTLRFVDNNNDGKYDVIFITSYQTVIVEAVDMQKKIIYNNFKSYGLPEILLDTDLEEITYTIKGELGEMDFSEIQKGDVLSVAKSKSKTNNVIEILVSLEATTGKLQSINEKEMEITLSDEKFPIVMDFLRFKNEEKNLALGNTYVFFLDLLENVVYWEKVSEDGYAVVRKVFEDRDGDKFYISYMNLNGTWIDSPIAEKMTYKTPDSEVLYKYTEDAYTAIKDIEPQVVKMTFNSDGEVKKLETATKTTDSDENKLTITPRDQFTWRSGVKALCNLHTYQGKYFIEDDARLIIIPKDSKNKAGYEVREPSGFFGGDTHYNVSLCDIDEYGFSKLLVMDYEPQIKNTLFIVTKVLTVLDDGEARGQITGYAGDFENLTLTARDEKIFRGEIVDPKTGTIVKKEPVKNGDIIEISISPEGYVDDYNIVFRLSTFEGTGTSGDSYSYMAGVVKAIDAGKKRMKIDVKGKEYVFRTSDTITVQAYSESDGVETTSIHSILPEKKVFIATSWGNVQQIIIHE